MEQITVKQYRLTANGLELVGKKEPLKIGTKIFANLSNIYDICAVISEPDQYGNQKIVCMDEDLEFRKTSLFYKLHYKHTEPISKKFGIGYYWDDKENKVFSSDEITKAVEIANNFENVLNERANEKEIKRLQLIEQLKKDYSFLELNEGRDDKTTKKNIIAMLKRNCPDTKFSVRKEYYDCYGISWTNGAAEEEVDKIIELFSNHSFDQSGDFYDYDPSEFNRLFGGIKFLRGYRTLTEDIEAFKSQFNGWDDDSKEWKRRKLREFLNKTTIPNNYKSFNFDFENGFSFEF